MIHASLNITTADHTPCARLGGSGDIPVLDFGRGYGDSFQVALNTGLLTPAEQVAWLRDFAAQVTALADRVEQRASERVA